MLKVKNKKVISNIAKSSFNANKSRNIFAIVAIILTTVMFTTFFTIGISMKACLEDSTMRQVGGSAHGGFKYLTQEEYDKIKTHKSIKEIQYSIILGFAENSELQKRPSEIRFATDREAEMMFAKPTVGKMPSEYNEVAMDTLVLKALGIEPELGNKITLEYSLNGEKKSDTFVLSGYWEGDKVIPASQIFISREYLDYMLKDYEVSKADKVIGTISADIMFSNSFNIEKKLQNIIIDSGYDINNIDYGVNWAYMSSSEDMNIVTVLVAIAGILLIMFCGYLIIYNIFFISVSSDIRFYGLLKTIGTTSKQIGIVIRKQAVKLCIIGIPIGLVIGYLVAYVITPIALAQLSIVNMIISANPIIFIASIIFSIITVLISVRKPAVVAGKVSPIEAIRNTDAKENRKSKTKKGNGVNLTKMAFSNVFRNKKKAAVVTISLSLSLIILNCTYLIVNSFDMNEYLSKSIITDFVVADTGYFNVYIGYNDQETVTDEFIEEIKSQKGIEEIGTTRFSEAILPATDSFLENTKKLINDFPEYMQGYELEIANRVLEEKKYSSHIYGMDKLILDNLEIHKGEIDYDKLKSGNYIIAGSMDEKVNMSPYNIGDKVNVDFGNGNVKEYEVMAIASLSHNLSVRHSHPYNTELFLLNDEFISMARDLPPMYAAFNVKDDYEGEMNRYIKNYCENINPDMNYNSKDTFAKEFKTMQTSFKSVGLALSLIIGFIGIMNFINTMLTSIISRRRELAMLQSIGMTKKQINKMLVFEGMTYASLTSVFVLTIGMALSFLLVKLLFGGIWYFKLNFSAVPFLICIPMLFVLSLIVPVLCYKSVSKDSIVERLREVE